MSNFNFINLSSKNLQYQTQTVTVANGATFIALVIPKQDIHKCMNVLYMHVQRETKKCYVGITIQETGKRWLSGQAYQLNKNFGRALKKYGWEMFDSYILAFGEDRYTLNNAEITAITAAGGHKSKFTYNLSPGGDIVAENDKPIVGVYLPTGETRNFKSGSDAARSLGIGGTDLPMTVARGEAISIKNWWFRFKDNLEAQPPKVWGNDLRLQELRDNKAKPLVAINYKSGEVRQYPTQQSAAEDLGVDQSSVCEVANGNSYSAGGWWFRYEDDEKPMPTLFSTSATRQKRDKKVYAVRLHTGEKREFRNCTVADNELALHMGAAAKVALGKRASAGEWWFTYDKLGIPPIDFKGALVAKARSIPVIATEISTGNKLEFSSAKLASEQLGMSRAAISKVIKGELKAAKGYTFSFA
jgi:predicted XRE-type DNA-binding protein